MRFFPLLALLVFLAGCAALNFTPYDYEAALVEVERPSNVAERYSEPIRTEQAEDGAARYVYEDSLLSIGWIFLNEQLAFVLENKTTHSMKVIWDEGAFVDPEGNSGRIMHSGVRYMEMNAPQPPSVVARGGRLSDVVQPVDNVYYQSGRYGGWRTVGILQPEMVNQGAIEQARANVGKRFSVILPVEVEGVVNEYTYTFEVTGVSAGDGG